MFFFTFFALDFIKVISMWNEFFEFFIESKKILYQQRNKSFCLMVKKSKFQFFPKAGDRVECISSTFFIFLFAVFELLKKIHS